MKPGYRTTEFASVVASLLVALLVSLGLLSPGDEEALLDPLTEAVAAASALLANALVVISYIRSRTAVKTTAVNGSAVEAMTDEKTAVCE
ncbi:MAG TPA: hypothetical protein VK879_01575 [Candidatus Sulfomarinibacteraceae bacterium]|nr:hypothetical protein [Candidatus Sulfomarinibacteraceae bacterium]